MNAQLNITPDRYTLTPEDFDLCDQFYELLGRMLTGPVICVSASRHGNDGNFAFGSANAHNDGKSFSSGIKPASLGDKLQSALDQVHAQNPSKEERKAQRIAELNAELERLRGEAAA